MEEDFFSVAITIPFDAGERDRDLVQSSSHRVEKKLAGNLPLIPRLVVPCDTAAKACSIWTSFPLGEKTVRE